MNCSTLSVVFRILAMDKCPDSCHCWVIGAIVNMGDTTTNCSIQFVCNIECQSSVFNDELALAITLFKSINTCNIQYSSWSVKQKTHTQVIFFFSPLNICFNLQTETNMLCPQWKKNKHVLACPRFWTICLSTDVCVSGALMPLRWRNVWRCTSALRKRFVPFVSLQCKNSQTSDKTISDVCSLA